MKILVIGGSYFFGRWFVQYAHKEHNVTVMNRGNISIGMPDVREWKIDRHNTAALMEMAGECFDCVVDFCGYAKDDINNILEAFGSEGIKRYIFISTVDVYKKELTGVIDENSPLEDSFPEGPEGEYIRGKVCLEVELRTLCESKGIEHSSVRPGVLYGPANYAPRENIYFDMLTQYKSILCPVNATGCFQMVYVEDAAKMLLRLCEMLSGELEEAYNLCTGVPDNYESFATALKKGLELEFAEIPVTVEQVLSQNIPLPFPLTKEESHVYSTNKWDSFHIPATPLAEGLKRAAIAHGMNL